MLYPSGENIASPFHLAFSLSLSWIPLIDECRYQVRMTLSCMLPDYAQLGTLAHITRKKHLICLGSLSCLASALCHGKVGKRAADTIEVVGMRSVARCPLLMLLFSSWIQRLHFGYHVQSCVRLWPRSCSGCFRSLYFKDRCMAIGVWISLCVLLTKGVEVCYPHA